MNVNNIKHNHKNNDTSFKTISASDNELSELNNDDDEGIVRCIKIICMTTRKSEMIPNRK